MHRRTSAFEPGGRRPAVAFAGGGLALVGGYFLLPSLAAHVVGYAAIGTIAVAAVAVGVVVNRPARTAPWVLFAVGLALLTAGDAVWDIHLLAYGTSLPTPSPADVLYLAAYPLLVAGVVVLVWRRGGNALRTTLVDALILATAVGTLTWDFLSGGSHSGSTAAQVVLAAYPAFDFFILVAVAVLIVTGAWRSPSFALLAASLILLTCADLVYAQMSSYRTGAWPDALWLGSYVLWGAAALDPSMSRLGRHDDRRLAATRLAVIGVPTAAGSLFVIVEAAIGSLSPGLAIIGVALVPLLLLRLSLLVRGLERARRVERRLRVDAENALRGLHESEARFRAVTDNMFDVASVIDVEGKFSYQSPSAHAGLGYEPEELLGTSAFDLVHPDDLPELLEAFADGIQEPGKVVRFDYRARHKDGTWRTFESIAQNLLEEPGVEGVLITSRDITERRRVEDTLRASEERFRMLFERAPSPIVLFDGDGSLLDVNPAFAAFTGYARDELLEHGLEPIRHEEDAAWFPETLGTLLAGRDVHDEEHRIRTKSGEERWFVLSGSPVLAVDGTVSYIVGQGLDITERRRAQAELRRLLETERTARSELEAVERQLASQNEALREADRLKDELISVVSHDLRTPLTSIIGYTELLHEPGVFTDEQERFLATIERSSQRLLRLVDDLLFISRVGAGEMRVELEPVDLAGVAANCVEAAQPAAEKKGIVLAAEIDEVTSILGDHARLAELVDNLISNAAKFTEAGGTVTVRVAPHGDEVLLEVADTGVGISESDQQHLFERFFRASKTEGLPGAGLGLSIAKAIVEVHGGTIGVTSERGVGTTFSVLLPAGEGTPPSPRRLAAVA